ncbi:zinc finger, CCHC-type containing protein [Tanacetum coccineum]
MFNRAFKRVNTFVDFRTDLVEGSSKRAGEELEQESIKKQKVDEDKDTAELQSLMELIPDEEEVAIYVVPLATKSPSIVGWKIHKEGKKSYYQIIRADGKSQMYRIFSHMLKSFRREDLEDLYKLVKAKYESTRLVEELDLLLWGDLKTMFEPHVEDTDATCVHLHAGRKEISSYTIYNYRYAEQEASVNAAEGVNAASEEVSTVELVSTAYAKYIAEDASSKKFLVSNFTNYKMTNSRPVMEQYNELLDFKHTLKNKKEELTLVELGSHLHIDESLRAQDSDKLKGNNVAGPKINIVSDNIGSAFMSTSELNDSILWHARLGHVHFKRMQDMSKDGLIPAFDMDTKKCKTCMLTKITKKPFQNVKCETEVLELIHSDLCDLHATPSLGNKKYFVTFIDDAFRFCYVYLLHSKDEALDKFKVFKAKVGLQQGSQIKRVRNDKGGLGQGFWGEAMAVVRILDPKLKTLGERGIECIFVGYAEHSKAFRFYVIEPNDSVLINLIIESRDAIFNKNRFSSVPRPSHRSLINETEDISCLVFPEKVIEEDDLKTFDEAMKSQDVSFWKEAINDEMDSIMGNNTWVLADLPPAFLNSDLDEEVYINQPQGFIMPGNENKVDLTKEFLSSRFSIKDMGEADVIFGIRIKHENNGIAISQSHYIEKVLKKFNYFNCTPVSTLMDISEKMMPDNGQAVSQLKYSRVIGRLMYDMTCTRPDIAFAVGQQIRYTNNPSTQHWQAIQWVLKYLKKTIYYRLTYIGYPLVLEGYTDVSWISNTEDNSSTSGWVFLLAAGKEAEWLKNLLLEIPLWSKPIAHISIQCDSVATLAKAYSHMYNGKSRHLAVRHRMIRKLITNGVVSIEFVRSQQNLDDHLTKGLARDLVIKSAEGMRLKSN